MPDVTYQLGRWSELHPNSEIRSTPVVGVILTDGELDHVLGLLHLREASRWTLYTAPPVAEMIENDLRLMPALRRVVLTDLSSGRRLAYAPCVGELSDALREHLTGVDAILFDGTFWRDDELCRIGAGDQTATAMGHVPVGDRKALHPGCRNCGRAQSCTCTSTTQIRCSIRARRSGLSFGRSVWRWPPTDGH